MTAAIVVQLPTDNGIPRMVERNKAATLAIDVYNSAGGAKITSTAASATIVITVGNREIVNASATPNSGGSTAIYSLAAATTADEDLTDQWLEVWTITLSDGTIHTVRQVGYLVRHVLNPKILDADLIDYHNDLDNVRPSGESDFSRYRDAAWRILNRDLIRKGRRPELVLDSWALVDLHISKTLEILFKDLTTYLGDGRYLDLADRYRDQYAEQWGSLVLKYDRDEDGTIDASEGEALHPVIFLNRPPRVG